jgi:signal transduction histidine kinase
MTFERLTRHVRPPPRSQRSLRYRGDDVAVAVSALPARDRDAVRKLYATLMTFDAALPDPASDPDEPNVAAALAKGFALDEVVDLARSIGTGAEHVSEDVRHALHDVRGSALTSLVIEVQRARAKRGQVRALRTLTLDHLKVMRNALLELDDAHRTADLEPREHSIDRLAETLARVTGDGARGEVKVAIHRTFQGGITMSCLELGALDRAVLNVLNNAVRHSAADRVELALVASSNAPGSDLCVCIANALDDAHARALRERFGDDTSRLFIEPFSTTGSGDGLKICVELVSSAYGLVRPADALEAGLVGATIDDGWFIAWMHWPAVA